VGVQATATVTLATTATGPGTLSVWVAGRLFRVGIETGDTPTAIGELLELAINAHANLPVTSNNVTGVVTCTARNKGLSGNTIALRCEITSSCAMTAVAGAAYLASGTLEGDPTTPLANIQAQRFHIIACWTNDPTEIAIFKTHILLQSTATSQKWGFVVAPSTEAISSAIADAATDDSYRVQLVNLYKSDVPEYELCAAFAALRAKEVNRNKTLDYLELPGIPAPYDQTAWPSTAEEQTALEGGVAVLRPVRSGGWCQVVRNVTTRVTSPAFRDA
jgi:phage tail sheath gpL-like